MKLVKLSLVAAVAAGTFSVANATTVDEVIKDIDVSGVLRYRYYTGTFNKGFSEFHSSDQAGLTNDKQNHLFRSELNFQGAIADNFKAFIQFNYASTDGGYGSNSVADTSTSPTVRQLYLAYTNDDYATSVKVGRQQLNTIWTDNGIDGLVGTGVKVENKSFDGLTVAAFAIDSVNSSGDGDFTGVFNAPNGPLQDTTAGNIYGIGLLGSYELGGGKLDPQLWLAYWRNVGGFYAVDAAYSTDITDSLSYKGNFAYLGNSLGKKDVANGNFFGLKGTLDFYDWDFSLGGVFYGKKDKTTITTIEDQGNLGDVLAGEEIFYSSGSQLNGDQGQNTFGYLTGGYTFDKVFRLGVDLIYGGTKTGNQGDGAKKFEAVARADYKYTDQLSFSAYYSYLSENYKDQPNRHFDNGKHNAVKLEALYKFN